MTEPFLSETERAIYRSGCEQLMKAILDARREGDHGNISLSCGLTPARGGASIVLRSAEVVKAVRRQVLVVACVSGSGA